VTSPALLPRTILAEFAGLTFTGPRARHALAAALAVGASVLLALIFHLQSPYWAGISGFVCIQASHPQSLRKGLHRIAGTLSGATVALFLFPWIAYDHAATMLLLFAAGTLAILGSLLSAYSYGWLLGGITTVMVVLGAMDDPTQVLNFAFYRSAEITLGTLVALILARLLLPAGSGVIPSAPGWASLFDRNWYMLNHAMKSGLAVAFVPVIWRFFELPGLGQMAISISAVMAVPVLTGEPAQDQHAITDRAAQRFLGCLLGGGVGMLLLTLPLARFFPAWLLVVMVVAAMGAELETGPHRIAVVGTQAVIAFILTFIQGWGPPVSLLPAIDRVAGMLGALIIMFVMGLLLGPPEPAESAV
jgi:uncharacterized membrane protein YccC